MKAFSIEIHDDKVVRELEETAKAQHITPEALVLLFIVKAIAPFSRLGQKTLEEAQSFQ